MRAPAPRVRASERVSGTWSGTITRGLGPNSAAAEIRFQLDGGAGSTTVGALTGCRIIARRAAGAGDQSYADFLGSVLYGSMLATTIDCPAATGLGTVDLGVDIHGEHQSGISSDLIALRSSIAR